MPVQIKHNNGGSFYHIAIDIAKEGAQLFDLTPYVKGRVGDNNFGLQIDWYRQGQLMNVNGGYKPVIDGLVGNYSFDKNDNLKMADDASVVYSEGKPDDCGPAGQVTYYFPEQMFPKEGIFKGYLGLVDDKGNRYSGVDIWFTVLADNARMGIACDFYISKLEKAIATAEEDLKTAKKSMQDVVDEFTAKINDLTSRLTTQVNQDQAALDALEEKIKQDGLFTEDEADAFKKSIQKLIDTQVEDLKTLTDKVNSNELLLSGYNVCDFGAVGDGETDDTVAIQKAITQVALDWKKDNFKTNLVVMPAGRYKVTNSIVLPPYVKLVSAGLVTIESYLTNGATIQIKWLGDDDPDITGKGLSNAYQLQDWQRGYIIEGSRGGFSLVSKVKNDDNVGIEVGFHSDKERGSSNLKNVARSGLNNISIGNYGVGLRLNGLDLFIFNFVNMHIEYNKINVQNMYVDGGGNYGENIYFDRCVIANGDIGIDQTSGGYDMTLNECSLGLNKLAISNSDYSNNNITIIGGNLEGNTLIYDASKGSIYWLTSLNIISTNIYIRPDKASSLTMFKGPLILNLDNPYIISTLELNHPEYLCDEKVFVTYNRNPVFARTTSQPIFITERDNALFYGNDIAKLPFKTDNGYGKLATKDNGLSPELQAAGFTSSFKYTRSDADDKNWDWIRPDQKIDVRNKSTFFLELFGLAHLDSANINFAISFYDQADKLIKSKQFYAGVTPDKDKVLYGHTPAQPIPVEAASATIGASASCTTNGASFEFAYLGLEME
ncbi:hypothetical protein FD27_GL001067 [Limosilactobacillus frumenti DSM 13145]|uniref:Rhamnogalacturonase A/B/Epimerase-like pectate lyase domain-containing protein n=1 Tax=Limosilactobacillus frumenti DSM 13145 TaxID=1423746 RepID=A0A0R1P457_9LACO|nr:glycosyl hydrolase family 28-related protein [Limosilactobacillus frumenti]KRL27313.1 hypothetical protein FD27_GL001067 [Limosilactobacillus frumenti DSM 13145]QFG72759.1 hypothetical protein LF145_05160 [Limosilactobacillus frumenti]